MRINKIPKGVLRIISREIISSARNLGMKLERIDAKMWEKEGNVGSINVETKDGRDLRINYFKREREVVFCDVKKGENNLVDKTYETLSINYPSFTVCY